MTDRPAHTRRPRRPLTSRARVTLLLGLSALALFPISPTNTDRAVPAAPAGRLVPAVPVVPVVPQAGRTPDGLSAPGKTHAPPTPPGALLDVPSRDRLGTPSDDPPDVPSRSRLGTPSDDRLDVPSRDRLGTPSGVSPAGLPTAAPLLAAATGIALVAVTGVAGASRSIRRRRVCGKVAGPVLRRAAARLRAASAADVVEAALAGVVDRQRVEVRALDHALVRGAIVAEVAHLLTELVENALVFSPPGSPVEIRGRAGTGGYHVTIVDEGIGMSDDELATANARVRGEQSLLVAPTRCLGHHLVGRLAERLGILVWLHESPRNGVTARVVLPRRLLDGRARQPGEGRRATSSGADAPGDLTSR
ncbi:ATP-binding protein [Nonomuraea sp. NPDC048916]|uniref:sensor histidine kinase n=1 Tax=Nonomuraea sp. NPDC048916 TaxID=3154232 RepID=UPI0033F48128